MNRRASTATVRPWGLLLIGLLLAQSMHVNAQTDADGVSMVLLVHHPYPDSADPLGFPFPEGSTTGYYYPRYAHYDKDGDGFDFPHAVFDGVIPIEGLPEDGRPYASTRDAYRAAYQDRIATEAPATIEIATQASSGSVLAALRITPTVAIEGDDLRLWTALVEDHVFYDGGRLGNGVTDHRFTVRDMRDHGPVDLTGEVTQAVSYSFEGPSDQMLVAAWLQAGPAEGLRFDAHEVVQSAVHPITQTGPTRQTEKAVLMQLYSATWCDPCLFGDRAAAELADEYSVQTAEPKPGPRYWQAPPLWVVPVALMAGIAVAVVRLPGGRP